MHIDEYSRETNEALSNPTYSRGNSMLFRNFKRYADTLKDPREASSHFARSFNISSALLSAFEDSRLAVWDKNKTQIVAAIGSAVEAQLIRSDNNLTETNRLALAEAALNAVVAFVPNKPALV